MALRHVLLETLAPHFRIISIAAFLAGVYFLSIFHNFDRRTEIEEHGLVAGYSSKHFSMPYPDTVKDYLQDTIRSRGVAEAVHDVSQQVGLNSYVHSDAVSNSTVVYSHVMSARGDSRECLVVVVLTDWRKPAIDALSMGVHLSRYFSRMNWLSRDVFILFADRSEPYAKSVRSWIDAYLHSTDTMPRNGLIRQAIVLDLPKNSGNALSINVEGINGMLPNQDLANTFIIDSENVRANPIVRSVWDSVLLTASNGQVHSVHAAFLDVQINCFTAELVKRKNLQKITLDQVGQATEGTIRSLSAILQQLHHSFNFYFYNSLKSHVSNGIYFYPIFAIMAPLASHLTMSNHFVDDFRCVLAGLMGVLSLGVAVGFGTIIVAVQPFFRNLLHGFTPPPVHECSFLDGNKQEDYRSEVMLWISIGVTMGIIVGSILGIFARTCYPKQSGQSFTLPVPFWCTLRAASGFVYMCLIVPVLLVNFALSIPLAIIIVPCLLMAAPLNFRVRPLRSLAILAFLGLHAAWLHERTRMVVVDFLQQNVTAMALIVRDVLFQQTREVQRFLPIKLLDWLARPNSVFWSSLYQDPMLVLYSAARDFRCVDGMLFPVFCFVYLPFVLLLFVIALILPEQKVYQETITKKDVKVFMKAFTFVLGSAMVLGIVWRSTSSAGVGDIKIS